MKNVYSLVSYFTFKLILHRMTHYFAPLRHYIICCSYLLSFLYFSVQLIIFPCKDTLYYSNCKAILYFFISELDFTRKFALFNTGQGTGQCPTHFSQATSETRLFRRTLTSPCATRRTSIYKGLATLLYKM